MEKAGFFMENWPGCSGLGGWGGSGRRKISLSPLSPPPRARHYYCNSDNDNNNDINM